MVTLTTHKDVRSYPCRSMESAIKLVERFIAGVTNPPAPHPGGRNQPAPVRRPAAHRRTSGRIGQTSPIPVGDFFCSRTSPTAPVPLKGTTTTCARFRLRLFGAEVASAVLNRSRQDKSE